MTRPFALLVISLGLSFLGGMVFLHFHLLEEATDPTLERTWEINQRVIDEQLREHQSLQYEVREILAEPSRFRFAPILTVLDVAEKQVDKLSGIFAKKGNMDSDPRATLHTITGFANEALHHTEESAKQLFRVHGEEFGLLADEADTYLQQLTEIAKAEEVRPVNFFPRSARLQLEVEQQLVVISTLNKLRELLGWVAAIGCHRGCGFTSYFPVLMGKSGIIQQNETSSLRISIGSYQTGLDPATVKITVDGKPVTLLDDGTAKYLLPTSVRGLQQVNAQIVITNPLTGQAFTGESSYQYRVE